MDRIFLELDPQPNSEQIDFRARIQISEAFRINKNNKDLPDRVTAIENSYKNTILKCKKLYLRIHASRPADRLYLYWDIADNIKNFLSQMDREGFFLNYPKQHFSRDLEVTTRTIGYLLTFRKNVVDKKQLDPTKSWAYYVQRYYRRKKDLEINS